MSQNIYAISHPVTPKGGQDEPRVTSYLTIKLRVGRCLTAPLHKDSNNIRVFTVFFNIYCLLHIITITYNNKTPAILFASASAKKTTRLETILVYNLITLAWLIKC